MKHCKEAALVALFAVGLGSCSDDNPWRHADGQGGINLRLEASADVTDARPEVRGVPTLTAPDPELFSIRLVNQDTQEEQTWTTLEEFRAESGFDVGSYTLTAYYGNVNECGFDKPYFAGTTDIHVYEARETSAEVTARLGNVMLSAEYTDAFKSYFRDYSLAVRTAGEARVDMGQSEDRPGFVAPGNVTVNLNVTHPSGKTLTLQPGSFAAQARHHYHLSFDVNTDPTGDAALVISFDDSLEEEDIHIPMSDELVNSPEPTVYAKGFESGVPVEVLAKNPSATPLQIHAVCKGGFSSCRLVVAEEGGSYAPAFGREVELVNADEALQEQLRNAGIDVQGLFKGTSDNMAIVELTNLPEYLPEGKFNVSLEVTDVLGRTANDAPVLNIQTFPVALDVVGGSAIYTFDDTSSSVTPHIPATVTVTYNGQRPLGNITFKNQCKNGGYNDCEVVGVTESARTRNLESKEWIFNLKVCDVEHNPLGMQMFFKGEKVKDFTIEVDEPDFTIEADAFATYTKLKVVPDAGFTDQLATIVNGLNLYLNGEVGKSITDEASATNPLSITRNPETGIVILNGLTPSTDYRIGFSVTTITANLPDAYCVSFRTEDDAQVSNGDFSQTSQLKIDNLQCGGTYYGWPVTYTNKSSIDRQVPDGWATINPKTANPKAKNQNTWFVVPSTYVEDGRAVVRNVGFSSNGTTPARTGGAAGSTNYNTSAASFTDSEKVAGELFLGSYSYDIDNGSTRTSGIPFASRPKSLSFDYTYTPEGTDTGVVTVALLNAAGTKIAERTLDLKSQQTAVTRTVTFPEYAFGVKVAAIRVDFKSSKNVVAPIHIPSGSELNEGFGAVGNHTIGANQYHAVATGSVLTIDNVKLNY